MLIPLWKVFVGEVLGTMTLILFGNGVGSNVTYKRSLGYKGGWLLIAAGWGFAVYMGVLVANIFGTGGHLNPAITLTQVIGGPNHHGITFTRGLVYWSSELLGATIGQVFVNIMYFDQIRKTACATVLGTHATKPINQARVLPNILTEYLGTLALIGVALFSVRLIGISSPVAGFVGPLAVGLVVFAIGMSLGGTTGYAINPARDAMPRLVHFVMYKTMPSLKSQENISSNWKYAPIPFCVPLLAACTLGGFLYVS